MPTLLLQSAESTEVASSPTRPFPWGIALIAWCGFLFVYGVNRGDLYRNEGLRARVSQEMFASGDWIVPHLYGQPIFTKPPLMYWLICLCSAPFGEVTTATARFPSVLAAACLVGLFFWNFKRYLGKQAGYLAALFAPLAIFWLERVPSAEIDALQVAWVAAAILFFLRALEAEESLDLGDGRSPRWWLLAGLCVAGGTLTKWTAPAFFYLTAITWLWWRGRLRLLIGKRHLLATLLAAGLVAVWIGLAMARTSVHEFWNAVIGEAAPRLAPGGRPRPYPWLETFVHPLVVLAAALPLSLCFLSLWRSRSCSSGSPRTNLLWQGLHCWLWPNLLFWTLHPDHTLRNRAPLFPAIAGLAVFGVLAWQQRSDRPWHRPREWVAAFLIIWMALKVIHVEAVMRTRTEERRVHETARWLASLLPGDTAVYLFGFKDECLMFYLGVSAQRVDSEDTVPINMGGFFCILTEEEWAAWAESRPASLVAEFRDGQGDRAFLIETERHNR